MNNSKAPSPLRSADYEAIESALLESARGRWFLAEYNKRNRSADTKMLLEAISRLEASVLKARNTSDSTPSNHLKRDLVEMAEAISKTRDEISAMRTSDQDDNQFTTATEELDAIVEATEKATSDILEAAEDIQELAWVLREKGTEDEACDRLDARATDIYTACSFQDLTGQRTSKVVETLRFLERRVLAMIEIWGLEDIDTREVEEGDSRPDSHLLNGPARRGEGIDQDDVDQMIEGEITFENGSDTQTSEEKADSSPVESETAPPPVQTAQGEVDEAAFAAPADLDVSSLDETKTRALFS